MRDGVLLGILQETFELPTGHESGFLFLDSPQLLGSTKQRLGLTVSSDFG